MFIRIYIQAHAPARAGAGGDEALQLRTRMNPRPNLGQEASSNLRFLPPLPAAAKAAARSALAHSTAAAANLWSKINNGAEVVKIVFVG